MTLWKCPKCGREFRNKNQSHSCVKYSVEDHFAGKPTKGEIDTQLLGWLKRSYQLKSGPI